MEWEGGKKGIGGRGHGVARGLARGEGGHTPRRTRHMRGAAPRRAATGAHRSARGSPVRSRRFRGDSGRRPANHGGRRAPRFAHGAPGSDPESSRPVPRPVRHRHMAPPRRWRRAHAAALAPASRERVGRRHVRALALPSPHIRAAHMRGGGRGGVARCPTRRSVPGARGRTTSPRRPTGRRHAHTCTSARTSLPRPGLAVAVCCRLFPGGVVSARLQH